MVWEAFLNGQSDKKLEPKLLGHDGWGIRKLLVIFSIFVETKQNGSRVALRSRLVRMRSCLRINLTPLLKQSALSDGCSNCLLSNCLFLCFRYFENSGTIRLLASVAKLVDALDLGSSVFDVTVRVRPLAPRHMHISTQARTCGLFCFSNCTYLHIFTHE